MSKIEQTLAEILIWNLQPLEHLYGFHGSVHFSSSVVSDSLWPHELQYPRLPCPSPIPRAYSNACPSCQWCHPTILSSVVPFSSTFNLCQHQSLFQWKITSGGQSIGVSASTSVLPMNIQDWFPLGLTGGSVVSNPPAVQEIQEMPVQFLDMEQWTGSKLGKEYIKVIYCYLLI